MLFAFLILAFVLIHLTAQAMFSVNAMQDCPECAEWYQFHSLAEDTKPFRLTMNKQELEIEVFRCDHTIPTLSFGISEVKQKLKEEYAKLPGKEIGVLRKQGVQVRRERDGMNESSCYL
jgi:hypothetical protein